MKAILYYNTYERQQAFEAAFTFLFHPILFHEQNGNRADWSLAQDIGYKHLNSWTWFTNNKAAISNDYKENSFNREIWANCKNK